MKWPGALPVLSRSKLDIFRISHRYASTPDLSRQARNFLYPRALEYLDLTEAWAVRAWRQIAHVLAHVAHVLIRHQRLLFSLLLLLTHEGRAAP